MHFPSRDPSSLHPPRIHSSLSSVYPWSASSVCRSVTGIRVCLNPQSCSPLLQTRQVKELAKQSSILGTSNWDPKFTAVMAVTPGGFSQDLLLEGLSCPCHSCQKAQERATEELHFKHRAKQEQMYTTGEWGLSCHLCEVRSFMFSENEEEAERLGRRARGKLTSRRVIITPARSKDGHVCEPAYSYMARTLQSAGP